MRTAFYVAMTASAALALSAGASVAGQKGGGVNTAAQASYGSQYLSSGFTPDPYRIDMYSGGGVDAATIASGCTGMVATQPDFELTFDAGSLPLIFGVTSDYDTTLVINGPDGTWYCDDDSGEGTDPIMRIPNPQSGVYDVFVGAFGGNSGSAQLYITELDSIVNGGNDPDYSDNNNTDYSGVVDPYEAANYGTVNLRSGFTPDPRVVSLRAGGSVNAQNVASGCYGYVSRSPDVELSYTAGSLPLIISVGSSTDTTLLINGPDGQWYCDDDSGINGSNPSVRWNSPMSGTYDIWVGTYRSGASQPARLNISEVRSE